MLQSKGSVIPSEFLKNIIYNDPNAHNAEVVDPEQVWAEREAAAGIPPLPKPSGKSVEWPTETGEAYAIEGTGPVEVTVHKKGSPQ